MHPLRDVVCSCRAGVVRRETRGWMRAFPDPRRRHCCPSFGVLPGSPVWYLFGLFFSTSLTPTPPPHTHTCTYTLIAAEHGPVSATMSELAALQRDRLIILKAAVVLERRLRTIRGRIAAALVVSGASPQPAATNAGNCASAGQSTIAPPLVTVVDDGTGQTQTGLREATGDQLGSDFDHTDDEMDRAERIPVDLECMSMMLRPPHRTRAVTDGAGPEDADPEDMAAERSATPRRQSTPTGAPDVRHDAMPDALGIAKTRSLRHWAQVRVTTMFLQAFHRSRYPWKQLAGTSPNSKSNFLWTAGFCL